MVRQIVSISMRSRKLCRVSEPCSYARTRMTPTCNGHASIQITFDVTCATTRSDVPWQAPQSARAPAAAPAPRGPKQEAPSTEPKQKRPNPRAARAEPGRADPKGGAARRSGKTLLHAGYSCKRAVGNLHRSLPTNPTPCMPRNATSIRVSFDGDS